MTYRTVLYTREEKVGIIYLNRPPVNAINYDMLKEIEQVLTEVEQDNTIGALIITGKGEKGLSAGFDIRTSGTEDAKVIIEKGHEVFRRIELFPKPVIVAINGFALGGGCEISLACHFRIMVNGEKAVIGLPEIKLGIMPGWGGTQRLPRIIGKARALEMILLGKRINAMEALNYGLIHTVSTKETLMDDARQLAKDLAEKAPLAIKAVLDVVNRGIDTSIEEGLEIERIAAQKVGKTNDAWEGMNAFLEKRKPNYRGE